MGSSPSIDSAADDHPIVYEMHLAAVLYKAQTPGMKRLLDPLLLRTESCRWNAGRPYAACQFPSFSEVCRWPL